jgi:hypothetical protein
MITNRHGLQSPVDVPSCFLDSKIQSALNPIAAAGAWCTITSSEKSPYDSVPCSRSPNTGKWLVSANGLNLPLVSPRIADRALTADDPATKVSTMSARGGILVIAAALSDGGEVPGTANLRRSSRSARSGDHTVCLVGIPHATRRRSKLAHKRCGQRLGRRWWISRHSGGGRCLLPEWRQRKPT